MRILSVSNHRELREMSHADVDRVRGDLEAMRQAIGAGPPFGRADVWINLGVAALGGALAAWSALAPWEHRWVMLIPVGLLLGVWLGVHRHCRRNRARQPVRWREYRQTGLALLVVFPLVMAYLLWGLALDLPWRHMGGATVFFLGLGMLVLSVVDRTRRFYALGAVPTLAWGLTFPLYSTGPQQGIAAGIYFAVIGLAGAAFQARQLRTIESAHDAD